MHPQWKFGWNIFRRLPLYAAAALVAGCAAAAPVNPPENYRGPIAEAAITGPSDDWTFEVADGTKAKYRPEALMNDNQMPFPLWVGKLWTFETTISQFRGRPPLTMKLRVNNECQVTSFKPITVKAGTFDAFECRCVCDVIAAKDTYNCDAWTWWYAPAAKTIVRVKRDSTTNSFQLEAYSVSPASPAQPVGRP